MLRIAIAQINPTVGDLTGNRQKIIDYARRAKATGADIVAFPELAICGYPPEDLLHKNHFIRDNIKSLKALVKEAKDVTIIVGFVDVDKDKNLYNAAAVICDGKIREVYHKQELPNYGVFDEKRYFAPGHNTGQGTAAFFVKGVPFAVNICEDIWASSKMDEGRRSKILLQINLSASPYAIGKLKERERLLKKWAKKTGFFICYTNLVGGQDELVFDGGSFIVNPEGAIIASGKQFEEDLIVCDLPVEGKYSATPERPPVEIHLSKRLSRVEEIYKALVMGTRDYMEKNGFRKVVIGLSGGIDSALVAVIAVDALGKENVIGISMPSRYTSTGTRSDAGKLAKNLGMEFREIPIEKIFSIYSETLACEFKGLKPDTTEENIQARIRGNILMAMSNKFGWLVLTTGNKSEVAVGYCTLYGDLSGGFAVIKDVPKTKVYKLARFVNSRDNKVIPDSILERPPTAELRANQKDQDSLPPYNVLDVLLEDYVEKHRSLEQISKRADKKMVKDIIKLVDRSEYKRRQAPPGIKITPRAFGKDWRLPITNKYRNYSGS